MLGLGLLHSIIFDREQDPEVIKEQLEAASVPVTVADCRTCANPCDEEHASYPDRFKVDMESQMLGSIKPYRRQVVISTGQTDWEKEVTETKGSLAAYLVGARNQASLPISEPSPPKPESEISQPVQSTSGVFRFSDSTKISILNGSHHTMSDDLDLDTVLVFPDYTVVVDVPRSKEGAQGLWESAIDPRVGREGSGTSFENSSFRTWVLPYSCVILLCSHKKRDNRCAIAAPLLERAFIHSLQENGWAADTQLECQCLMGPPLENLRTTPEETEKHLSKELQSSAEEKRALILQTSHIGGHRYAGNCIIYTPQGSSVWYGRVSPHEVESIVVNTLIGGLVLPPLLRGGLNISRPPRKTLNDW